MSVPKKAPAKKKVSLAGLAAAFTKVEAFLAAHPEAEALLKKLESEGVAWLEAWVVAQTAQPAPAPAPAPAA